MINDYFELNSDFTKEELRKKFNGLYKKGKAIFSEGEDKNDNIFLYILKNASPRNNHAIFSAVYVLMSYYFECCDIFETPI